MNKRIQNTKRTLLEALCALAAEKKIENISVTELCRKANINRTTFYKYFNVPADVLIDHVERIFVEAFTFDDGVEMTTYERMEKICRKYKDEKALIELFFSAQGNIQPIIEQAIPNNDKHSVAETGRIYLISGGVAALSIQWVKQGMKESHEEIAKILAEFIDLVTANMK